MNGKSGRWNPRPAGIAALIVGFLALIALAASLSLDRGDEDPLEITGAGRVQGLVSGIPQAGDALGADDAEVTIQVLNDLQCVRCAEFQLDVIGPLISGPVRDGDVRLEFRHYAVGSNATSIAAFGAVAAGLQDHQWQYIQVFAVNQDEAAERGVTEEFLEGVAAAVLGLDGGQWSEDLDSPEVAAEVEDDAEVTAELRLTAEPAVIVEGPGGSVTLPDSPDRARIDRAIAQVR